jgi:hypothetical protein
MDLSTQIARRIANRVGEAGFAEEITIIIESELDPVMEVLREALESRGQIHGVSCRSWADTVLTNEGCNCWVSRARKIVGEE